MTPCAHTINGKACGKAAVVVLYGERPIHLCWAHCHDQAYRGIDHRGTLPQGAKR